MIKTGLPYELTAPLRTARLVLRTMTHADIDDLHAYQSRADVCRYLPFEPRSRDEVAEKVAKYATALALAGDGDYWQLAIERAHDPDRVIGDLYFTIRSTADATGEIGWTLHPDHACQGYMTEAAGAVLDVAFDVLGLHRVSAVLDPRNDASAALCKRLGMRQEAYFRENVWFKGTWADTAVYAILDREPRARAGRTAGRYSIGASARLEELETDPHALLARLREHEPASWVPSLDGWLVTRRDLALQVMRDARSFTVQDPRFSTGQVIGSSMLTLDGEEHRRHRDPFAGPFRLSAVRERFTDQVARETEKLIDAIEPLGEADLRRSVAGPLAVAVVTSALGFEDADVDAVLECYAQIVASVTEITAGQPLSDAGREAYAVLSRAIGPALEREPAASLLAAAASQAGGLERERVISNAAVLLFGGIETTEGMIANAVAHLLTHLDQLKLVRQEPGLLANAIEESLRLEPAAAVIDRYATADVELEGAQIGRGDLVRVSIAAANRDPAVFPDPDRFDIRRPNARQHVAFAHGPHVCIGMHLARLEAHTAVAGLLRRLPDLRLDPARPAEARGLVFRKPPEVRVTWRV